MIFKMVVTILKMITMILIIGQYFFKIVVLTLKKIFGFCESVADFRWLFSIGYSQQLFIFCKFKSKNSVVSVISEAKKHIFANYDK